MAFMDKFQVSPPKSTSVNYIRPGKGSEEIQYSIQPVWTLICIHRHKKAWKVPIYISSFFFKPDWSKKTQRCDKVDKQCSVLWPIPHPANEMSSALLHLFTNHVIWLTSFPWHCCLSQAGCRTQFSNTLKSRDLEGERIIDQLFNQVAHLA